MSEEIKRVSQGQPLSIRSRDWNKIADTLRDWAAKRAGERGTGPLRQSYGRGVEILIKNSTGSDLAINRILAVGDPLVSAIDYPFELLDLPVFDGTTPASTDEYWVAITQEPIASTEIGKAVLIGFAICTVNVTDVNHWFATTTAGDNTKLTSSYTGTIQIYWKDSGTGDKTALVLLQRTGNLSLVKRQVDTVDGGSFDTLDVTTSTGLKSALVGTVNRFYLDPAAESSTGSLTHTAQNIGGPKTFYDIATFNSDVVISDRLDIDTGVGSYVFTSTGATFGLSLAGTTIEAASFLAGDNGTYGVRSTGKIQAVAGFSVGGGYTDGVGGTLGDGSTVVGGIVTAIGSGSSSGTNTGDQNVFTTIAVSGQSNVVADSTTDTLTLAAGTGITITTDAATDTVTIVSSGVSDGDKGDITVSGSGATWTVDNGVITLAKQADLATQRVIGRNTGSTGVPEAVTLTQLLDWIGSAAQGDLLYRGAASWARLGAGTAGQFLQTAGASANPTWASVAPPEANGFRLSCTTSAVPTTDINSSGTIYLVPFTSDRISLYDGTNWYSRSTSGSSVSLSLSGLTASKVYDVFAYWTGSAVALELSAAWTNDTTRADALAQQNGVWVKSGTTTRRHVGYFYAKTTTTTCDDKGNRIVINRDNVVKRVATIKPGYSNDNAVSSISFSSNATYKRLNGGTNDTVNFLAPLGGRDFSAAITITATVNAGDQIRAGVGIDSTTSAKNTCAISATSSQVLLSVSLHHEEDPGSLSEGYHYVSFLASMTNANTATIWSDLQRYGSSSDPASTYMTVSIMG